MYNDVDEIRSVAGAGWHAGIQATWSLIRRLSVGAPATAHLSSLYFTSSLHRRECVTRLARHDKQDAIIRK